MVDPTMLNLTPAFRRWYQSRLVTRYDVCVEPVPVLVTDQAISALPTTCLLSSDRRFIMVEVVARNLDEAYDHALLLLLDTRRHEAEVFDALYAYHDAVSRRVMFELELVVATSLPGWTFIETDRYCPIGPQRREVESPLHPVDNFGHCASWTRYYLEARLTNPQRSRRAIISALMARSPDDLWMLINDFTDQLMREFH